MTRPHALALLTALLVPALAVAAPVLSTADVDVVVTSHTTCEVTMTLRLDGATEIEHRIESFEGSAVTLVDISGAVVVGEPRVIGRTRSVTLRLDRPGYRLRYRAVQPSGRRDRCPLWVPAVATSGQLGAVRLAVRLPDGSRPASAMPSFAWSGVAGTAAVSHVPAFVRVSYAAPGETPSWDLLAVMDAVTVVVFVVASLLWLWRRARERAARAA